MDRAYVAVHLEEDRGHWWFRGRRAVLLAMLRRTLPPGPHRLLRLPVEIGRVSVHEQALRISREGG